MPYKVLFVCLGNICRSPAAENIMNYLLDKENLNGQIFCDSAGTGGYHIGSPPDQRMAIAAASKLGIKLRGSARQLQKSDLAEFDLILAMDRENYQDILALDRHGKYHDKVQLMCNYCSQYSVAEVPDPYYGGTQGFNYVIDILLDACTGLIQEVKNNTV